MRLRSLAAGIASLVCAPQLTWAQDAAITRLSPWGLLAQALLSLAVVVGLIYLVYFGIRRLGGGGPDAAAEGPMRVIQARHLGGDRWLYLVEIEGRRIVVGGAAGQIAAIAELGARQDSGQGGERLDEA